MPTSQPWLKIYDELGIKSPGTVSRTMASFLEDHAKNSSDADALHYCGKSFSYAIYNGEANKLANALRDEGVRKGDVVGLHMPNIPQYVLALAAISKLGAIGTGISPILAPGEVLAQIKDANVKVVLSFSELTPVTVAIKDIPTGLKAVIICGPRDYLDAPQVELPEYIGPASIRFTDLMDGQSDQFQSEPVDPESIFMIQYTGGTTGPPKGAMLSHRSLVTNAFQASATHEALLERPIVLGSAFPLFHVAGLTNAITTCIYKGLYHLIPDPRNVSHYCEMMKLVPPTHIVAVPALYEMWMANPAFKEIDFSQLKVAHTGAAPVTQSTLNALNTIIGENKIADGFGMTEAGPTHVVHPNMRYKKGSVGLPVAGADLRIVDIETGLKTMPVGEPGEIITSGPHLMSGYLGRPKATVEALRELDGKIWMYTGDVGYVDEEGYLFLCDRAKDMLIVGGYKVFSVEVEDKLCAMPAIASCAIIGTPDEKRPGNDVVNLYVELAQNFKNDPDAKNRIVAFCRENMAAYKIPKAIHLIDEIPLTAVGKIDKKALRKAV